MSAGERCFDVSKRSSCSITPVLRRGFYSGRINEFLGELLAFFVEAMFGTSSAVVMSAHQPKKDSHAQTVR